jgi:hypothetical protein
MGWGISRTKESFIGAYNLVLCWIGFKTAKANPQALVELTAIHRSDIPDKLGTSLDKEELDIKHAFVALTIFI